MALSARLRIFVNEFAKSQNVTKAAIAAGCTKRSAPVTGSRWLKKPNVKAAVEAKLKKIDEKAELSASSVLAEIRKHAFAQLKDAYNEDGTLKPVHEMPSDISAALQGLESDELFAGRGAARVKIGVNRKVKKSDSLRALEMLAKHFKLLTDVTQLQNSDGGPIAFIALPPNGSEALGLVSPANPAPVPAASDENDGEPAND